MRELRMQNGVQAANLVFIYEKKALWPPVEIAWWCFRYVLKVAATFLGGFDRSSKIGVGVLVSPRTSWTSTGKLGMKQVSVG
ncbi:hypothetical protein Hamer_G006058 [Homarus americanus]|uniref:Uncharacterized protein n=1 Tax=Homarus americanus TaxID=6706 RepID=A0A8J5JGJ6_HOMAM|nr:hypothetical protein Hamer_G006058 [Homarus americanus]